MNSAVFNEERERRQASRVGRDEACDYAILVSPNGEIRAEVLDESLQGIRVSLTGSDVYATGDVVTVAYAGETRRGTVHYVQPRAEGGFVVGIGCAAGAVETGTGEAGTGTVPGST